MAFGHKILACVAWLTLAAGAPAGIALADENTRAAEHFELCAQCHGEEGQGNQIALAPPIAGLSQWYVEAQLHKFQSGVRGLHPDDVAGLRMYPMSLTLKAEGDIEAVAAYVAELPPTRPTPVLSGGDAARGQAYYGTCVMCHGADASGVEAQGGPNLRVSSDWYMMTQLHKFQSGVRGGNPADAKGAMMRAMSMTLADEQAMKDVIAYIVTLGD
jgi:cytochrome c oxidase subunit 2